MVVRFGPFEADPAAGELRKDGRLVRLQEQPFQVLLALIERAGQVVTREELRTRLWPSDAFGEFDQGLNTAINKLREALGDSAADPRFIETLPKRGYRFVQPIEQPAEPPPSVMPSSLSALPPVRAHRVLLVSGLLAVCVLGVAAWMWRRQPVQGSPYRHFTLRFNAPLSATPDARLVAVSPDGRHIAIIDRETNRSIWVQDLDTAKPRKIAGTELTGTLFWSPDSQTLAFTTDGKLKKVGVSGGPIITLLEHEVYISGGAWNPDGRSIVFASGTPSSLHVVGTNGGPSKIIVDARKKEGPSWIWGPSFVSVDQRVHRLLYETRESLALRDMDTGASHSIGPGRNPAFSPKGYLIYRKGRDLWAQRFSLAQAKREGEAVLVAHNATDPSVAADGTLVYRDIALVQLAWRDRRGGRVGTVGQPAIAIFYPALSPDGKRVAAEIMEETALNIWTIDVARGTRIRVSASDSTEIVPVWSPGGDRVAYGSYRAGNIDIFARQSDAEGGELTLADGPLNQRPSDWTRDGRILYSIDPRKASDLAYLKENPEGRWESTPLLETPANEASARVSPDGRYVAYMSNESGRYEIYVRELAPGGRKWSVSSNGAAQVRWGRNGRELFYIEQGTLMAVPVSFDGGFSVGTAVRLFSHPAFSMTGDPNYDISSDGQRILLPERVSEQESAIHVLQNWSPEADRTSGAGTP